MLRRIAAGLAVSATACGGLAAAAGAASTPALPTATNGKQVQLVAGGLHVPTSFAFGAGKVFVGDEPGGPGQGGVYTVGGGKATLVPGSPPFVSGLVWHAGTLYVAGNYIKLVNGAPVLTKATLSAWSGWSGNKFSHQRVIWKAPKGFPGFNGLGFAGGRLYAGVDLGLTNDHGPATKKTPYLYDILSFDAGGKHLKVFATGMRQPWQLAFPAGSSSPFVTDFGQDKGVKNAPDLLLRVREGDNYGFPQCSWNAAKLCKGFTKPFRRFLPHTDVGGIAIVGRRIYLSEFGFAAPLRPAQIVSLPLKGGQVTPLVTGFPSGDGVIGVGASRGWIYFGDTDGSVYRVHS